MSEARPKAPGISSQRRRRLARYLETYKLGFTALRGAKRRTTRRYGVKGTPTLIVVDQAGVIRFVGSGAPAARRAIAIADRLSR